MRIGIIGAGSCNSDVYDAAGELGFWIGKNRRTLVCGGLGGVMEAAAKGAKKGGGVTIGILPGGHASEANPYIDYPIVTDLGHARNVIVVRTSDLLVAIGGEYGTLSEIAIGLKIGKTVIGYQSKWSDIEGVIGVGSIEEVIVEIEKFQASMPFS